jgi:hypothetical protein
MDSWNQMANQNASVRWTHNKVPKRVASVLSRPTQPWAKDFVLLYSRQAVGPMDEPTIVLTQCLNFKH